MLSKEKQNQNICLINNFFHAKNKTQSLLIVTSFEGSQTFLCNEGEESQSNVLGQVQKAKESTNLEDSLGL